MQKKTIPLHSISYRLSLFSLLILFFPTITQATYYQTNQSAQAIQNVKEYYKTTYLRDIDKKIQDAKDYLARRLQTRNSAKFALILDIDETALSNFESLQRMSFTQNPEAIAGAFMLSGASAIEPVLALYQYAQENNVATFFICERPNTPEMVSATVKNLTQAGYNDWTNISFRPTNNDNLSTKAFKTHVRKQIANEDYTIVLNIGDSLNDLDGGYSEVTIRLPNPFYQVQ